MPWIQPFDRKGFDAHIRQLTQDFRDLRKETERLLDAPLDWNRLAHEVLPDLAKRGQAYRAILDRFHAKYPRGTWPIVFARHVRFLGEFADSWRFESVFADEQEQGKDFDFVPALALQFPVSKPLLEALRPLMIEVDRWWRAVKARGPYATGKQRYPDADHLRSAFDVLVQDLDELLKAVPPNQTPRQSIAVEDVIEALDAFETWLLGETWVLQSSDWQSGRIASGWFDQTWPFYRDTQHIYDVLTGRGLALA